MKSRFDSRCARITLISCLVALAAGCREPLERRAVAQIPGEGQVAGVASASPRGVSDVSVRRVWADDYIDFYAASISPDGRYLSMIDWSTVDLAVRDLQTGELHRLTNVVREEGKPYEDAGVSVFSRDGRQLVVGWQYFPDLQLRLVDFEPGSHGVPPASDPTVLFHNSEFEPYYPFDWSPDDGQILAKVYTAGGNQLALISATDGTYRALKSFDWREPTMAEFSPDGKFVAYDFLPDTESADRDIYVAAIDGQQDTRIVEGPGIDRLLGWHPDGSILFHSDRGGTPGIWRVPMMDGRAAGPAELVRADIWNAEPLGFAGRDFYYGVDANPVALYTATVSLETGELIGTPEQLVDPTQVSILGLDWSPDGRFLAYSGSSPGMRGSVLGLVGPNGEERVRLDLGRTRRILWHPDGRSLIAFARDSKDRRGFYRIDLESGTHRTILRTDQMEESTPRGNFAISPDGATLYYAKRKLEPRSANHLELVAYDLETGKDRHVAEVSSFGQGVLALSPDGSTLAAIFPTIDGDLSLGTVPVGGGNVTSLRPVADGEFPMRLGWTADGTALVYVMATPREGSGRRTWLVPLDGTPARLLELGDGLTGLPAIDPRGRRVAFLSGEPRGEVWVLEGLGTTRTADAEKGGSR